MLPGTAGQGATDHQVVRVSLRDPDGAVVFAGGRVFRLVNAGAARVLLDFLDTPQARRLLTEGKLVGTTMLPPGGGQADPEPVLESWLSRFRGGAIFEHERIPFPSYPYEWSPSMLHAAADLTLGLAAGTLEAGFGLKDATPYNILFRGSQLVFVDLLSFERREVGDATWRPYA